MNRRSGYKGASKLYSSAMDFFWERSVPRKLTSTPVIADTLGVRFSVRNSGSLFQSFSFYVFRRGTGSCPHQWGVRNSEVSTRRDSTVVEY